MFNIDSNGIVTVNRGDCFDLPLSINLGTSMFPEYPVLENSDHIYIGVMEPNQPFETAIVRKHISFSDKTSSEKIFVRFDTNDTVCLLPGKYYYQVKLERIEEDSNGDITSFINTVVDKTLFYIKE